MCFSTKTSINLVHILSLKMWTLLPPGGGDAEMEFGEFADLTAEKCGGCRLVQTGFDHA